MIPVRYKDGVSTTVSTLSTFQLSDLTSTVLDPVIEEQGGWIEFPTPLVDFAGRRINRIWFPPFGSIREGTLILMSFIQSSAQMLLIGCDELRSGKINEAKLNKMLYSYQNVVMGMIFGRKGFISEHLMCNRMDRSGRAVLLASQSGSPEWCSIPAWMMKALRLSRGDLVIVGRDPAVWDGSIECFRVRGAREDVIRLHPLVFKQLNADSDGDQVWVLAVPSHLKHSFEPLVGSFMKSHAEWPKPWNLAGTKIDWETVEETLANRSRPDGFSVGPEDIINQTSNLVKAEEILGKELSEECLQTAQGMSLNQWWGIACEVNEAMLKMKVGMGPVGSAAMNLRILAGNAVLPRKSACLMAERIEQLLLDAKRAKNKGAATYCSEDILELLNRNGNFSEISEANAVILASTMLGLKPSNVRPMIKIIWDSKMGLSQLVRTKYPLFAATTQTAENRDIATGLALKIFRDKKTDPDGVCKFIVDGLAKLAQRKEIANKERENAF